jgi:hypothetical protein
VETILGIIDNIPTLLKFFIPGAICIRLYFFLYKGEFEKNDSEYFIFESVIISGLIVYPLEFICGNWNDFWVFVLAIAIGVGLCYAIYKIMASNKMQHVLQILHVRRTTRCFWEDVLPLNRGNYAQIKIKGDCNVYLGSVEYLEDKKTGDIYISITRMTVITPDGDKIKQDIDARLVFNTSNVEYMIFKSVEEKHA